MKRTLTLQSHQLPATGEARQQLLVQYFSGKQVETTDTDGEVQVHLTWPEDDAFYIDPFLGEGLAWWKGGTNAQHVPHEWVKRKRYQLSLNDNWTLYAWSQWLAQRLQAGGLPEEVIILHVDDHRDCMPPLLFHQHNHVYTDALTGQPVDLTSPSSIEAAIKSGAIAVGSFMPPFLHYFPRVQLRHLQPTHRLPTAHIAGAMQRNYVADDLLCPACQRPALGFGLKGVGSGLSYHPTDQLDAFLADIPANVPVLLHVDMDYFNNRFDGDSDWQHHAFTHNPGADQVAQRIQQVFTAVINGFPTPQLEDITVALSPGFFPAELWRDSVEAIDALLV